MKVLLVILIATLYSIGFACDATPNPNDDICTYRDSIDNGGE